MNGAMADPLVSTISAPNPSSTRIDRQQPELLPLTEEAPQVLQELHVRPQSRRLLEIAGGEHVVPRVHHRLVAGLERAQPQRVLAEHAAHQADRRHDQTQNTSDSSTFDMTAPSRCDRPNQTMADRPEHLGRDHVHDVHDDGGDQKPLRASVSRPSSSSSTSAMPVSRL